MEQKKRTVDFIKPVFELRMLTMSGYMPDLVGCQQCGEYEAEGFYFFPATGTLVCTDCQKVPPQGSILLTKAQLAAMRHIIYSESGRIFGFKMSGGRAAKLRENHRDLSQSAVGKEFSFSGFLP